MLMRRARRMRTLVLVTAGMRLVTAAAAMAISPAVLVRPGLHGVRQAFERAPHQLVAGQPLDRLDIFGVARRYQHVGMAGAAGTAGAADAVHIIVGVIGRVEIEDVAD